MFVIPSCRIIEVVVLLFLFCSMNFSVLIEKMLRTAPDVHKIFVLIKAKNKEAVVERLKNEVWNS